MDKAPKVLYCTPGAEAMFDTPRAVYEAMIEPYLDAHSAAGSVVIERWSVHDPMDHMPPPDLVLDQIGEWVADNGEVSEGGIVAFEEALTTDLARNLVSGTYMAIVGQVRWRQAKDRLGTHTVTWDTDGRPLLDGQWLRHPTPAEMAVTRSAWRRVGGRSRESWARDVRDHWTPILDALPVDSIVLANGVTYWTKASDDVWTSGHNRVSTLVLLSMHDEFVPVDRPLGGGS